MQISDEAVEAAARGLAESHVEHLLKGGHLDYRGSRSEAVGNYVEENWLLFETQARAALEAALPHLLASQGCGTGHSAEQLEPAVGATAALARSDDEYWSVSVEFNGENILTIGQSKYSGDLSGTPNIEDYADVVRAASAHLASFIGPDEPASCFVCGGDCASANPPVIDCPMRSPLDGGEAVHSPAEREGSRDEPRTEYVAVTEAVRLAEKQMTSLREALAAHPQKGGEGC